MTQINRAIKCICGNNFFATLNDNCEYNFGFNCKKCKMFVIGHGGYDLTFDLVFDDIYVSDDVYCNSLKAMGNLNQKSINYVKEHHHNLHNSDLAIDVIFANVTITHKSEVIRYLIKHDMIKDEYKLQLIDKHY